MYWNGNIKRLYPGRNYIAMTQIFRKPIYTNTSKHTYTHAVDTVHDFIHGYVGYVVAFSLEVTGNGQEWTVITRKGPFSLIFLDSNSCLALEVRIG